MKIRHILLPVCLITALLVPGTTNAQILDKATRAANRETEIKTTQERFTWWPTDAQPAPVKDDRGGYWWWPSQPGTVKDLWGNRGYIYVYKLIYDYKEKDPSAPKAEPLPVPMVETKPSLLIKKIIKNVKIYFDYNKADLRNDHFPILQKAVHNLKKNPESSILITGNCDTRGSDEYNLKLGAKRGDVVKQFMLENGISEDRIKIVSRGKLDAVAPVNDILGMQKDRNAQFMVAEVEEVNIPADQRPPQSDNLQVLDNGKYLVKEEIKVESAPQASTREYVIQEGDSLWRIAAKEMGNGHRWKYLYELNKDRIANPDKLKKGTTILIPVE